MNTYEVIYILGFDHDDWDKLTVTARDEAEAKQKAIDKVPPGCRVKKIKFIARAEHLGLNEDGHPIDPFGMRDAFDNLCAEADKLIQTHNTMEQTKIQSVTPQGTFEHNGKTFHKFDVILDNGMVGEVNAMTPDKWKVGDEVVVKEHQQTKWGPRLKLDKPGFQQGGGGAKGGSNNDVKGIVASWAVGCAMQAAGDPAQEGYDSILMQLARLALKARSVIKEEVEV